MRIEHTHAGGTLLHGTSRGDGTAQIVKAKGWRWGRELGAWYVPRSRDTTPNQPMIEATAASLREAGHDVDVEVDDRVDDIATVEARRSDRAAERAGRLTARADRTQDQADRREAAARDFISRVPLGQPVLVGHHSEGRALRDQARVARDLDAAAELQRQADTARGAARTAGAATGARYAPITVGNRIERLEGEERRLTREIAADGFSEPYYRAKNAELERTRADLTYWNGVRAQQIADGVAPGYSAENVAKGDRVQIGGTWYPVARANAKTVAVHLVHRNWTDRVPWHKVTGHRPATTERDQAEQ